MILLPLRRKATEILVTGCLFWTPDGRRTVQLDAGCGLHVVRVLASEIVASRETPHSYKWSKTTCERRIRPCDPASSIPGRELDRTSACSVCMASSCVSTPKGCRST